MIGELYQFSQIDHIENYTFDPSLEQFRKQILDEGSSTEGTLREIIQNAMDAKNHELSEPVRVNLVVQKVPKQLIPGIDEVFRHIHALKPGNEYNQETVKHMQSLEDVEEVTVLTAEDLNTKGLTGAESNEPDATFPVYAYNKGVHATDQNDHFEKSRGGSHGVGKIANNAASDIHLMFFANCDDKGRQHIVICSP